MDKNIKLEKEKSFLDILDEVTLLAQKEDMEALENEIKISKDVLIFSKECVGDTLRKGTLKIRGIDHKITNFSHMCRVAYMVKHFFPNDTFGRTLALVHDTKEEPSTGMEDNWKKVDEISGMDGLVNAINTLTEENPSEEEIMEIKNMIPEELDPVYIAKYKKFINELKNNWEILGNIELCDRLDASTDFVYLEDLKYANRIKYKALETFGRIWATIELSDSTLVEIIKENCRIWFEKFNITEDEVINTSIYFKK